MPGSVTVTLIVGQLLVGILAAAAAYQAYTLNSRLQTYRDSIQELADHLLKQDQEEGDNLDRSEVRQLLNNTRLRRAASKPDQWLEAVKRTDEERSIRLLRAAHRRFPGSRRVTENLLHRYHEAATSPGELEIRRQAVLNMRQAVERFLETCSLEDFERAIELEQKVDGMAEHLADEIEEKRRNETFEAVKSLEEEVQSLSESGIDDETLDEIAELDDRIDQEVLEQQTELQELYDEAKTVITERITPDDEEEYDWDYNLNAVEAADEAWEMFKGDKNSWTDKTKQKLEQWRRKANPFEREPLKLGSAKKRRIENLAYTLGGWDSQKLLPAVNTYVSSVHSEIFKEMDWEDRKTMTVKMIEASAKS